MDPVQTALVKAGESAIQVGEEAARSFLSKVAGPAAEEAGLLLQDKVRLYRFRNQINALSKAQRMMKDAGLQASEVPLRTLLPLLEGAAIEDDSMLSDKWAALLANAASTEGRRVPPSFPAILSELSPVDAAVLDTCASIYNGDGDRQCRMVNEDWVAQVSSTRDVFDVSIDNLERLGLIVGAGSITDDEDGKPNPTLEIRGRVGVAFTHLGWAFMQACQAPKAAASSSAA